MRKRNYITTIVAVFLLTGCGVDLDESGVRGTPYSYSESNDKITMSREDFENMKKSNRGSTEFVGFKYFLFSYAVNFAYYVIGLIVGILVFRDARTRTSLVLNVPPLLWGAIAFVDPALGILVYWGVHYSKFSENGEGA